VRRAFEKDVPPELGKLTAADVQRKDVMRVLDQVVGRGARRQANILLASLRQMFRFALMREIIAADPTLRIPKSDVGGRETERERVLSEDEIRELAQKMPKAKFLISTDAALWIMLATGCRVGEISRARRVDVDLEQGRWLIPAEHAKNGRAHTIWLSNFAKNRFARLLAVGGPGVAAQ
jgi:integrase